MFHNTCFISEDTAKINRCSFCTNRDCLNCNTSLELSPNQKMLIETIKTDIRKKTIDECISAYRDWASNLTDYETTLIGCLEQLKEKRNSQIGQQF